MLPWQQKFAVAYLESEKRARAIGLHFGVAYIFTRVDQFEILGIIFSH